jgi:hydroxymethylpyrimidine pyrophosphatase-like HAD family hydrolase
MPMQENSKPILISTDIDDCLIPWENRKRNGPFNELALQRAVDVTNQAADSIALHWNTGRNLASLKNLAEPTAKTKPILDGMKLDFLSTNNGQELYVNVQHAKTSDWIRGLAETDMDPRWTQDIEQRTGWSLSKVVQARANVLEAQGFNEVKGDETQSLILPTYKDLRIYARPLGTALLTVQCFDTQPGFRISEWSAGQGHLNTEAAEQAGLSLQVALQKALKDLYGTETTLSHKPMEAGAARFLAFTLFPLGVNKGAILNLLLSAYMPQAQAVITVGDDDYNDLDLLQPDTFTVDHRELPNYPVVVGENQPAKQAVADNPRHELVELEHWDAGVTKQLQKIKAACLSVIQEA